jgi:hypothetical protein
MFRRSKTSSYTLIRRPKFFSTTHHSHHRSPQNPSLHMLSLLARRRMQYTHLPPKFLQQTLHLPPKFTSQHTSHTPLPVMTLTTTMQSPPSLLPRPTHQDTQHGISPSSAIKALGHHQTSMSNKSNTPTRPKSSNQSMTYEQRSFDVPTGTRQLETNLKNFLSNLAV